MAEGSIALKNPEGSAAEGGEAATAAAFCIKPQFINNGEGYNIRGGESNDVCSDVGSDGVDNDVGVTWRDATC